MSQRTALLTALFWAIPSWGQIVLQKGEHLLRGVYHHDQSGSHIILNNNTLAMGVVDLPDNSKTSPLKKYPSGLQIEVCVQVDSEKQKPNFRGELLRVRMLEPAEPLIFYSGILAGCSQGQGCKKFGQMIKNAPFVGSLMSDKLPKDYFSCK